MRIPSSFHSTATRPSSATGRRDRLSLVDASIGEDRSPDLQARPPRGPSRPAVAAIPAATGRSPHSITARRRRAAGTPACPWRPRRWRSRRWPPGGVRRRAAAGRNRSLRRSRAARKSRSSVSRRALDPAPRVPATVGEEPGRDRSRRCVVVSMRLGWHDIECGHGRPSHPDTPLPGVAGDQADRDRDLGGFDARAQQVGEQSRPSPSGPDVAADGVGRGDEIGEAGGTRPTS